MKIDIFFNVFEIETEMKDSISEMFRSRVKIPRIGDQKQMEITIKQIINDNIDISSIIMSHVKINVDVSEEMK